MAKAGHDADPGSWAEGDERTVEFQALLAEYDGDFQKATDALVRGEKPDPTKGAGNPSTM